MFHDELIAYDWRPVTNVINFHEERAEPTYADEAGGIFTFSAAVEGGEAIPFDALSRAARGPSFALAGGVMLAALALFWIMEDM
jgi:hypothetical protein